MLRDFSIWHWITEGYNMSAAQRVFIHSLVEKANLHYWQKCFVLAIICDIKEIWKRHIQLFFFLKHAFLFEDFPFLKLKTFFKDGRENREKSSERKEKAQKLLFPIQKPLGPWLEKEIKANLDVKHCCKSCSALIISETAPSLVPW